MGSARRGGVDAGAEAGRRWEERNGGGEQGNGQPEMGGNCEGGVKLCCSVGVCVGYLVDGHRGSGRDGDLRFG